MSERRNIKNKYDIEGFSVGSLFSSPTLENELALINNSDIPASTLDTTNASYQLKQYCIKGSYNSAITGKYVNTEMIKYLLYRGCRFLDFEIFSFDNEPFVAMSTDTNNYYINTTNKISLKEILSTVYTYAFSAPSPIHKDPLFINLRIKTSHTELYDKISEDIKYVLKDRMYLDNKGNTKEVTANTILSDIREKIIIVLDKNYIREYNNNNNKLNNCVNMIFGINNKIIYSSSSLLQENHSTPNINEDFTTDVTSIKLVYPDADSYSNTIYYPMVSNYGAQIVLYPFKNVDFYLKQYEKAFSDKKAGIVLMSQMISYIKNINNKNILSDTNEDNMSKEIKNTDMGSLNMFGTSLKMKYDIAQKDNSTDFKQGVKQTLSGASKFLFKPPGI